MELAPILDNQAVAVKRIVIESESRVRGPGPVRAGCPRRMVGEWRHLKINKPATIPGDPRDWDTGHSLLGVPALPLPFHSGLDSGGIGLCLSHSEAFS